MRYRTICLLGAAWSDRCRHRIRLEILTLGRNFATVNLEFKVRGHDLVGRQSQTWVRFPDLGWKAVAAHVSTVGDAPFW